MTPAANYPEILTEFHSVISETLKDLTDKDKAALTICEAIRKRFGGEMIYIPKGYELEINERHREIYAKFTGKNHVELGREFDLSMMQIYRIVKAMHKAEMAARQRTLDDFL